MAYVIPSKRQQQRQQQQQQQDDEPWVTKTKKTRPSKLVRDEFPALCPAATSSEALDFTQLSFEEEVAPITERRFEPGWARLSFQGLTLHIETDYYPREPTLNELAGKTILQMKRRWIKHYTDRGEEPYDYDYEPPEPVEDDWSDTSESDYDSPEYFSE